jgi:hypothetical protein
LRHLKVKSFFSIYNKFGYFLAQICHHVAKQTQESASARLHDRAYQGSCDEVRKALSIKKPKPNAEA